MLVIDCFVAILDLVNAIEDHSSTRKLKTRVFTPFRSHYARVAQFPRASIEQVEGRRRKSFPAHQATRSEDRSSFVQKEIHKWSSPSFVALSSGSLTPKALDGIEEDAGGTPALKARYQTPSMEITSIHRITTKDVPKRIARREVKPE